MRCLVSVEAAAVVSMMFGAPWLALCCFLGFAVVEMR
jgi:hypothetical protein